MYKLEGFDKNWLIADAGTRKATFTNLDAGSYIFHVKASDDDGAWNDKEASLMITVLPPWWRTPLAYIIYALLTAALLYFARRMIIQRARMRFALERERCVARRSAARLLHQRRADVTIAGAVSCTMSRTGVTVA